jgi:aminoglycoside phosphotransferase (APT) family kinase protein
LRLGVRIAVGASAELYAVGGDRVVKLYRPEYASIARPEAERTAAAHAAGLACPAVYGTVEIEGRVGLVLERIEGPTLLDELRSGRCAPREAAALLAGAHARVHATRVAALPAWQEVVAPRLATLSPEERTLFERDVARMPDGQATYHGDFHPGNLLLSPRGPIAVDWPNACLAPAPADVARSYVLIGYQGLRSTSSDGERRARAAFAAAYVEAYVARGGSRLDEIRRCLPIHVRGLELADHENPHLGPLRALADGGPWPA